MYEALKNVYAQFFVFSNKSHSYTNCTLKTTFDNVELTLFFDAESKCSTIELGLYIVKYDV